MRSRLVRIAIAVASSRGSGADGRDQGSAPRGEKVALRQPDAIKAQGFCLIGRCQHGVKCLPLCLAFVVVAIHHQPDIHTHRPFLPRQPCNAPLSVRSRAVLRSPGRGRVLLEILSV